MRASRSHMGLVVDECGQFIGIVTLEDLLEEIVGDSAPLGHAWHLRALERPPREDLGNGTQPSAVAPEPKLPRSQKTPGMRWPSAPQLTNLRSCLCIWTSY